MNYLQKTISLVLLCAGVATAPIASQADMATYIEAAGYAVGAVTCGVVAQKIEDDYSATRITNSASAGLKKLVIRALTTSGGSALYALCKWVRTGKLDIGWSKIENQIIKMVILYALDEAQEYTGALSPLMSLPALGDILSIGDFAITKFIIAQLIMDVMNDHGLTMEGRERAEKKAAEELLKAQAQAYQAPFSRVVHYVLGDCFLTPTKCAIATSKNACSTWFAKFVSLVTRRPVVVA